MSDKVKVRNMTPYDIGLKALNGIEYNIKPRLFARMDKDDVEYNMALAPSLFTPPAQLVVEDEELNAFIGIEEESEVCDKETAEKYLKGRADKLKKWLEENNKPHVLEIVYEVAKTLDLPASKIKVLQGFFPNREFINE